MYLLQLSLFLSSITVSLCQNATNIGHDEGVCAGKIDLMIVVDGSFSVTKPNFQLVKQWIKDLAKGFSMEHGHVQIGVVQYSYWYSNRPMRAQKYMRTEIPLGRYKTIRRFDTAVDRIRYQGYKTFTAHAIKKTVDYDFQAHRSRYPHARRAMVLLTDGKATDSDDLAEAVRHAEEDASVVLFAVGVGNYVLDELRLITHGHDNRIFALQNFTQLASIVFELPKELQGVCDCHTGGSASSECDICTRACTCKENVTGSRCDQCVPGTYNIYAENGCTDCGCDVNGTYLFAKGFKCDQITGQCVCKRNVVGEKCNRCEDGHVGFPNCVIQNPCQCNGWSSECDAGYCFNCGGGRVGHKCETCSAGNYISQDGGPCIPCPCNGNINRREFSACDVITGECLKCLYNTAGPQCETCAQFHYGDALSGNCQSCDCNIHGTDPKGNNKCHGSTGQCVCRDGITGLKCDQCANGLYNFPDCQPCKCNGWSNKCDVNTGICMNCGGGRVGKQCQTCPPGQYISMVDKGRCMKCPCNGNIDPRDARSCDVNTGKCLKCIYNTAGEHCESCAEFYFKNSGPCQRCDCDLRGSIINNCTAGGVCRCHPVTGQCPCVKGTTGKMCDNCQDGYTGHLTRQGCHECNCHMNGSISNTCDKVTGHCRCLIYHSGMKCERCVRGFVINSDGKCEREITTTTKMTTTTKNDLLNDEPGEESSTTTIAKTLSTTTSPTTTTRRRQTTTRAYMKPSTMMPSTNIGCNAGCSATWPSYCRGWVCKRRWPYAKQQYSSRRCYSTHTSCRLSMYLMQRDPDVNPISYPNYNSGYSTPSQNIYRPAGSRYIGKTRHYPQPRKQKPQPLARYDIYNRLAPPF